MATLGGFCFVINAIRFDYCFEEAIGSMLECCDQVVVVDAGSDDGTLQSLQLWALRSSKLKVISYPIELWDSLHGKTKLAHFQNLAIDHLTTDYQLLCQADEVIAEDSYKAIREAVERGEEGYMCSRINLWGDPYHELCVPQSRMPCSPQVIRLTKRGYKTYDDGENISCQASFQYVDKIKIWHMGFVRDKKVMKGKIINMQTRVFEMGHDPKLDNMDIFNPWMWFDPSNDVKPITESLPRIVQKWAMDRE
jgi:hypothetical protein